MNLNLTYIWAVLRREGLATFTKKALFYARTLLKSRPAGHYFADLPDIPADTMPAEQVVAVFSAYATMEQEKDRLYAALPTIEKYVIICDMPTDRKYNSLVNKLLSDGIKLLHYQSIVANGETGKSPKQVVNEYFHGLGKIVELLNEYEGDLPRKELQYHLKENAHPHTVHGVNLISYWQYSNGLGETARIFFEKFRGLGIPFTLTNIGTGVHANLDAASAGSYERYFTDTPPYNRHLMFVNGDAMHYMHQLFPFLKEKGRWLSAVWWWEFDTGYEESSEGFKYVDEVIVFSEYVHSLMTAFAPPHIPVRRLPFPFHRNWQITKHPKDIKAKLGLKNNETIFLFTFDFFSSYHRKNPEGVIHAFAHAFAGKPGVKLILKCLNGFRYPAKMEFLRNLCKSLGIQSSVIILDVNLSRNEFISLLNTADCYVSLHRGEGFGQGMAEAMALGKPVIATNYSGNTEFMNKDNSLLVRYSIIPANDDFLVYKNVRHWADADIEHAAEHMRFVHENRQEAQLLGQKAQQHIDIYFDERKFNVEVSR